MTTQIHLTLRTAPDLPVEAESLLPENVAGKTRDEIESLPLQVGNSKEKVGDHFQVEIQETQAPADQADTSFPELRLTGDLARFKRLGENMSAGTLFVDGSTGFHAGAQMKGGKLIITGDTGDWLGAHMTGGQIEVRGSAGHFTGAAYRGFTRGMSGGTIIIHGNAGNLTGARMRRGIIAVRGDCGDLAAFSMGAGTVIVGGKAGVRAGANMVRGTVVLLDDPEELMPTFRYNCTCKPLLWLVLQTSLARAGCTFPDAEPRTTFKSYSGDVNEGGRGEILLRHALQ